MKRLSLALACLSFVILPPTLAKAQTTLGHREGMTPTSGQVKKKMKTEGSSVTHHRDGMTHKAESEAAQTKPQEPGQGAFAAISEIVSMLRNDPQTDWALVDIGALRDHLSDMNRLVLEVQTHTKPVPGGISIEIMTSGDGGAAALRMVPAHAPVLEAETGWQSVVSHQTAHGLTWTVSSTENEAQIRALGFFGLMALGDHHREHHLAIARGEMHH